MNRLILIIIFSCTASFAQTFRIGFSTDFLIENKYLNYEFGPSLNLECELENIPFIFQARARFYLSELSEANNFSAGYTMSLSSFGININYPLIDWAIEPYLGVGVFYNVYNLKHSGNVHPSFSWVVYLPGSVEDNVTTEITAGIKFSANSTINFISEVTKTYNKANYKSGIFNFNSLFLKLGLLFEI